jgi:8-oxo-dGTP pyrophosphatase MutT (NUDIX family)
MSNWLAREDGTNPAPWIAVERRLIHADRWIRLRSDSCLTSSGVSIAPYYVLEYPDWVHIVAVDNDGRVIVTYQYRHAAGQICCELPCGSVEESDRDPIEAARRELFEETGYAAEQYRVFSELSPNPATHTNRLFGILALGAKKIGEPKPDQTEIIRVDHLSVEDIVAMAISGQFYQSMHVSSLFLGLAAAGKIVRASIGMVTQDTSLLHRSVLDNILYGRPEAGLPRAIEAAKRAHAHEFIVALEDSEGAEATKRASGSVASSFQAANANGSPLLGCC